MITIKITLNIDVSNWCENKMKIKTESRGKWISRICDFLSSFRLIRNGLLFRLFKWKIEMKTLKLHGTRENQQSLLLLNGWQWHATGMGWKTFAASIKYVDNYFTQIVNFNWKFLWILKILSFCHFEYFKYSFDWQISRFKIICFKYVVAIIELFSLTQNMNLYFGWMDWRKNGQNPYFFCSAHGLRHRAKGKSVPIKTNTDDDGFFFLLLWNI